MNHSKITMQQVTIGTTYSVTDGNERILNRTIINVIRSNSGRYKIVAKDVWTINGIETRSRNYESRFYSANKTMWTMN